MSDIVATKPRGELKVKGCELMDCAYVSHILSEFLVISQFDPHHKSQVNKI